jgi:pimeloyl-ACP methyl ester carboxylesterase
MLDTMPGIDRPTTVTRLAAGPVEYRLERRAADTVLVFHGGHQRAGLPLGEDVYADAGYTVLAPSRPGYGRTPLPTGRSVTGFADVTRALCEQLGITRVAAVVGTSAGGPTAVAMAARHADLVARLILQSAVGPLPYPDRRTRLGAQLMLSGHTERITWTTWRDDHRSHSARTSRFGTGLPRLQVSGAGESSGSSVPADSPCEDRRHGDGPDQREDGGQAAAVVERKG